MYEIVELVLLMVFWMGFEVKNFEYSVDCVGLSGIYVMKLFFCLSVEGAFLTCFYDVAVALFGFFVLLMGVIFFLVSKIFFLLWCKKYGWVIWCSVVVSFFDFDCCFCVVDAVWSAAILLVNRWWNSFLSSRSFGYVKLYSDYSLLSVFCIGVLVIIMCRLVGSCWIFCVSRVVAFFNACFSFMMI